MKAKALKKLKSRRGESITEVLIALLVSSLGLAMLAGLITAATRIVEGSMRTINDYVVAENQFAAQAVVSPEGGGTTEDGEGGSLSFAELATVGEGDHAVSSGTGFVIFKTGKSEDGTPKPLKLTEGSASNVSLNYYYQKFLGKTYVISYSATSGAGSGSGSGSGSDSGSDSGSGTGTGTEG